MAYCRWSNCDVYVYEDVNGGWTTHVASRRNIAGKAPLFDFTSKETLLSSYNAHREWHDKNTEYADINLPNAGKSFNDVSPGDCADRLEALRREGFDVPQYAIDALREEETEARAALGEKKE